VPSEVHRPHRADTVEGFGEFEEGRDAAVGEQSVDEEEGQWPVARQTRSADADAVGRRRLELRCLPPKRASTSGIELDQVVAQSRQGCSVALLRLGGKRLQQSGLTLHDCEK